MPLTHFKIAMGAVPLPWRTGAPCDRKEVELGKKPES